MTPKTQTLHVVPLDRIKHQRAIGREMWPVIEASFMMAGYKPIPTDDFDPEFDFLRLTDQSAADAIKLIYSAAKDSMMAETLPYHRVRVNDGRDEFRRRRVAPRHFLRWAQRKDYPIPEQLAHIQRDAPPSSRYTDAELDRALRACDRLSADAEKLTIRSVTKGSAVSRLKVTAMVRADRLPLVSKERLKS